MAILPNSRPSTGWRRGYLTKELHKRDFRCRRTKLRYSRTAMIKLWRQHLGAQLPGTLPQNPWQEALRQCSRHKTIGTIPRYPRDPKKIREIWEEKSQNSTSGCLTRATKGLRSKKNPNSPIYIILRLKTFFLDSTTLAIRSSRGLLSRGRLWYQLVTPTMRLYLPCVGARLRGITAW